MERKQTANEWLKELYDDSVTILDPDGWRKGDGVTVDSLITQEDFETRLRQCTCSGLHNLKQQRIPKSTRVLKPKKESNFSKETEEFFEKIIEAEEKQENDKGKRTSNPSKGKRPKGNA